MDYSSCRGRPRQLHPRAYRRRDRTWKRSGEKRKRRGERRGEMRRGEAMGRDDVERRWGEKRGEATWREEGRGNVERRWGEEATLFGVWCVVFLCVMYDVCWYAGVFCGLCSYVYVFMLWVYVCFLRVWLESRCSVSTHTHRCYSSSSSSGTLLWGVH